MPSRCDLPSSSRETSLAECATRLSPPLEPPIDQGPRRLLLSAAWRWLAVLNYEVEPRLLAPLVPQGTELDEFRGRAILSIVGFSFQNASLLGVRIPFHQDFAEVNLRFYVRRQLAGQTRRGVVFVQEMVPRRLVAWTARWFYGERFVRTHVGCRSGLPPDNECPATRWIEYSWGSRRSAACLAVVTEPSATLAQPQGEAAFVVDRNWAYTRRRDGSTWEYRVEHPAWRVWPTAIAQLSGNVGAWYAAPLQDALQAAPCTAQLVDGSAVAVFPGEQIAAPRWAFVAGLSGMTNSAADWT